MKLLMMMTVVVEGLYQKFSVEDYHYQDKNSDKLCHGYDGV